ncbi:ABC transporter ATP-binding protein [Halorubellus sp. PRR65]|uniref:ABC transporter ATP-binding protein n=1 Tax=Halorubellus sp. PRR65 TaxID=3098148 RepID=UPI002B25845F|nr:ABC transporter ATP-binding protein [Halorubellus sp. PRR65]
MSDTDPETADGADVADDADTGAADAAVGGDVDGRSLEATANATGGAPGTESRVVARTDGLGVRFGDVQVLSDVDLALGGDAVTAVVGANGSGKSTLLRALAGLLPPTAGTVRVVGEADRPVGFCPQDPRFRAHFTVDETLSFYADLLDATVDVDETLELVGLGAVADRRVDALSGGMVRLLGIAQAVLGDPGLLVLDEPASGLDPSLRAHIFETLRDVAATGPAVVVATHHLSGAANADRVLVLDDGDVVADGTPEAVVAEAGVDSLDAAFTKIVGDELAVHAGTEVDG